MRRLLQRILAHIRGRDAQVAVARIIGAFDDMGEKLLNAMRAMDAEIQANEQERFLLQQRNVALLDEAARAYRVRRRLKEITQ